MTTSARHPLQQLYDQEINFSINTFWDGGFDWALGDEMNGYTHEGTSDTFDGAVTALLTAARTQYPWAHKVSPSTDQ